MAVKTISISEVRQKLKDLLAILEATGEPYLITHHHRSKAVLVRYEDYPALVEQTAEAHPRIVRRSPVSGGEPILRGTRISVRHLIERGQAGQSVEDMLAALPPLTAAQIYAALSYYRDHQAEMDRLLEESRPERVVAAQGLKVEQVAEGIAVAHDQRGRW